MHRKFLFHLLKIAVGLAILLFVFWKLDIREALSLLANVDKAWLGFGITIGFACILLDALRLRLLVGAYGLSFPESVRIVYFVALFGILLPGGVGGEAYKIYRIKAISQKWSVAVSTLFLDRILGLAALLMITVMALIVSSNETIALRMQNFTEIGFSSVQILAFATAVAMLLALLLFLVLRSSQIRNFLSRCIEDIQVLRSRIVFFIFLLAGTNFLLRSLALYGFIRALSGDIPYLHTVVVCGITYISDVLPISVGSIGVWEGVVAFSLAFAGMASSKALAVAILGRVSSLTQIFVALCLWISTQNKKD